MLLYEAAVLLRQTHGHSSRIGALLHAHPRFQACQDPPVVLNIAGHRFRRVPGLTGRLLDRATLPMETTNGWILAWSSKFSP